MSTNKFIFISHTPLSFHHLHCLFFKWIRCVCLFVCVCLRCPPLIFFFLFNDFCVCENNQQMFPFVSYLLFFMNPFRDCLIIILLTFERKDGRWKYGKKNSIKKKTLKTTTMMVIVMTMMMMMMMATWSFYFHSLSFSILISIISFATN